MRGSTRQISMLKMKKTLTEILNGLWSKNKACRIFLAARLHLPTPASADGRGSPGSTLSPPRCHSALESETGKVGSTLAWLEEVPRLKDPWKIPSETCQGWWFSFYSCLCFTGATLEHQRLLGGNILRTQEGSWRDLPIKTKLPPLPTSSLD